VPKDGALCLLWQHLFELTTNKVVGNNLLARLDHIIVQRIIPELLSRSSAESEIRAESEI